MLEWYRLYSVNLGVSQYLSSSTLSVPYGMGEQPDKRRGEHAAPGGGIRVRKEHETRGRRVQRQAAGDAGDVRPGIGVREPLEEEGLVVFEHRELGVFAHDGLDLLHMREGGLAQSLHARAAERELPEPRSEA